MFIGAIAAIIGGIFIGLQGTFNAVLQKHIGLIGMTSWTHFVGFALSIPLVILLEPKFIPNLLKLPDDGVSWPVILLGALGLVLVPAVAFAIARTNPAITFSLVVVGQLIMSMIFQQFGLFGVLQENISLAKMLAILLILGGVVLFFYDP